MEKYILKGPFLKTDYVEIFTDGKSRRQDKRFLH